MHALLCAAAVVAAISGSTGKIREILVALGKSGDREQIRLWVREVIGASIKDLDIKFPGAARDAFLERIALAGFDVKRDVQSGKADLDRVEVVQWLLKQPAWTEMERSGPERKTTPHDLQAVASKFLDTLTKMVGDTDRGLSPVSADGLAVVAEQIARKLREGAIESGKQAKAELAKSDAAPAPAKQELAKAA